MGNRQPKRSQTDNSDHRNTPKSNTKIKGTTSLLPLLHPRAWKLVQGLPCTIVPRKRYMCLTAICLKIAGKKRVPMETKTELVAIPGFVTGIAI